MRSNRARVTVSAQAGYLPPKNIAASAKVSPVVKTLMTTSRPSRVMRYSFTQPLRTTKKADAGSPCLNRVVFLS